MSPSQTFLPPLRFCLSTQIQGGRSVVFVKQPIVRYDRKVMHKALRFSTETHAHSEQLKSRRLVNSSSAVNKSCCPAVTSAVTSTQWYVSLLFSHCLLCILKMHCLYSIDKGSVPLVRVSTCKRLSRLLQWASVGEAASWQRLIETTAQFYCMCVKTDQNSQGSTIQKTAELDLFSEVQASPHVPFYVLLCCLAVM